MGCLGVLVPGSFHKVFFFSEFGMWGHLIFSLFLFEADVRFMKENAKFHASQAGLSNLLCGGG